MAVPDGEVQAETVRQWRRGWWGGHWEPPRPLSPVELIQAGSLDAPLLALAWMLIESHHSVLVAAEPPDAGKTTTLTALLEFVPADAPRVYTRGFAESFSFLQVMAPDKTWILCNEISPDLQVYTWGPVAGTLFAALERGYAVATTIHADTLEAIMDVLTGYPLEVPTRRAALLSLVVTLRIRYVRGRVVRRVAVAHLVEPDGTSATGYRQSVVARYDEKSDALEHDAAPALVFLARRTGQQVPEVEQELGRRAVFLDGLARAGTSSLTQVREALETYRGGASA